MPDLNLTHQMLLSNIVDTSSSKFAKLAPVSIDSVTLTDRFWQPRREINRTLTIPAQYDQLESSGCLDNFRRVTGQSTEPFKGFYFQDSDAYKWLEAAAWSLASHPDSKLEALCEKVISLIASIQDSDGYLNSYFSLERKAERWSNLRDLHELYCTGHFIQAAIAYTRATSNTKALQIAISLADLICETFGDSPDQKRLVDGHEEIEMALVELGRILRHQKYIDQAQYFIDLRGEKTIGGAEYNQDHVPIREMQTITGHAVRAVYYGCGAADVALEIGDTKLIESLERIWHNMTQRRIYVSGGLGSRYEGEAFGEDFELPNARAYAETCAAIGSVMWNWRMLLLSGESKYADLMEWTLFNAVLPGHSLSGTEYFYQNPLSDTGKHRRQPWFGCACCPPNIARTLAQLPGYWYSTSVAPQEPAIWIHQFSTNSSSIHINNEVVNIKMSGNYPWDGNISIEISTARDIEFELNIRMPQWAAGAWLTVNGQILDAEPGTYCKIKRIWSEGDEVEISLPMPVRSIYANPSVVENVGCVALAKGPILYCVEAADNEDFDLRTVRVKNDAIITNVFDSALLGGIEKITMPATQTELSMHWHNALYLTHNPTPIEKPITLIAIPYFAWGNRSPGQMTVWLREAN